MEFRALRLAGFKSFVEATELRIEPGLTGVVGPNGCGKSNLLEALRWVMGEASPKSMRSGGMDDVIFAGTGTRPARSLAQVTLALAGAAGEEVEVSRRIERGAGSDYRINGRDARAQDVRLLFADSATGAHSPAIVGQGRISAIIAAKPAERRMLLEEAAGIAGLHVRGIGRERDTPGRQDAEQRHPDDGQGRSNGSAHHGVPDGSARGAARLLRGDDTEIAVSLHHTSRTSACGVCPPT